MVANFRFSKPSLAWAIVFVYLATVAASVGKMCAVYLYEGSLPWSYFWASVAVGLLAWPLSKVTDRLLK